MLLLRCYLCAVTASSGCSPLSPLQLGPFFVCAFSCFLLLCSPPIYPRTMVCLTLMGLRLSVVTAVFNSLCPKDLLAVSPEIYCLFGESRKCPSAAWDCWCDQAPKLALVIAAPQCHPASPGLLEMELCLVQDTISLLFLSFPLLQSLECLFLGLQPFPL